ncbi:MAG: family 78 glycoside hydrolase catalytic domain, partial [Muribaculaceae bacterium]|nr:family 78 glycoside hydrolase catalytic domain [Muribaculaceae bacterium]
MKIILTNLRAALTVVALSTVSIVSASHKPDDMRVNYLTAPLGIDRTPVFSWKLSTDGGSNGQTSYQIEVTDDNGEMLWDSGKIDAETPYGILYEGTPLQSSRRYSWRVRIWDADGVECPWSDPSYFETALLDSSDWQAHWIEENDDAKYVEKNPGAVVFAKNYEIQKPVRRARAYTSGLGVFSLEVNGAKVSDNVLEPLQTDYDKSVIYSTYDITDHIGADGQLRFAATVAGGMYDNPATERYSKINTIFGRKRFIMQVLLDYEDGTSEILATDGSWLVSPSPTVFASWYGGEDFDAAYNGNNWSQARECASEVGELRARFSPALKVVEQWKASDVRKLADGSYIVDFGTNIAGTYRFTLKGDKGSKIQIYPCEVLSAKGGHGQTNGSCGTPIYDCYTFAGNDGKEEWGPEFVYH